MLKKEQNDYLTQTGPGTPMGELFRCYWMPALLSEELPEPDCAPVRVKLLGERLLAFRDSEGRLGLIDEFCAHRGVSLWFARRGEDGNATSMTLLRIGKVARVLRVVGCNAEVAHLQGG